MANEQKEKARIFRELNRRGGLLLPNAWDAASARIFQTSGFAAIGTTSAGISYSRGCRDGEQMGRAVAMEVNHLIAKSVSIPVSADIEAGYGADPTAVAETISQILDAGMVGVNIEDNTHEGTLSGIRAQCQKLEAVRAEANRRDIALTINARTDTFLLGLGDNEQERLALTVKRGQAYLEAGADLVFVPLVVQPRMIGQLAQAFGGHLSVMAMPGAPAAAEMFAAGAKRVSIGQGAMLSCLGHLAAIAKELKSTGTWQQMEKTFFGFAEADALFQQVKT